MYAHNFTNFGGCPRSGEGSWRGFRVVDFLAGSFEIKPI